MRVSEIFTSIQGESSYVGLPCTFVRLSGCNLRCCYCDTAYAFERGDEVSLRGIVDRVKGAGVGLVEITGGEPLLWGEDCLRLISSLIDEGFRVLVETNGSLPIKDMDKRAVVIMDLKTPGSGMNEKMNLGNIEFLKPCDEVKFVICDRNDYDWALSVMRDYELARRASVLMSPAIGLIAPRVLAGWMVEDRLEARFNLQIHKFVFGPEERGV